MPTILFSLIAVSQLSTSEVKVRLNYDPGLTLTYFTTK